MTTSKHGKLEAEAKLSTSVHEEKVLACLKERQAHLAERIAAIKGLYAVITPEQKRIFEDFHADLRVEHGMSAPHSPGVDEEPKPKKH
jgi:hypothetical protein